jgi:hypothetical protein
MNAVLGDINVEDPTAGAAEDVEMADGVTAAATEQAVRKEKSKDEKKKEKKDKKRKSMGADFGPKRVGKHYFLLLIFLQTPLLAGGSILSCTKRMNDFFSISILGRRLSSIAIQ